jgi:hypothetical protein
MITDIKIPRLCHVKQTLPATEPIDVETVIEHEWERLSLSSQVANKRITLGFGSRGVAKIDVIARKLVSMVKASNGYPFIVPAMGSHGGATPEGQVEVLAGLGITEESVGCPIMATMDVVDMGLTEVGLPALVDRNVAEADGLILTNRIKVHTDFHGPHESGLLKMLAIGLGKERGASSIHQFGVQGLRDYMPVIAKHLIPKVNWIAGFGLVEDGSHAPAHLEGFSQDEVVAGEQRLLETSRSLMPRLPVDEIDVLVIDEMGKEISGAGMDTNIIGRWMIEGEPEPERPNVKAIVVLDLTAASHGNATAYGLADFMARRLFDKIDFPITTMNLFTSGFMQRARMPLVFETDRETIQAAIFEVFRSHLAEHETVRMVRIRNTMQLEELWVSPNLVDELRGVEGVEGVTVEGEPAALEFRAGLLF